jgi:hypothetical protein
MDLEEDSESRNSGRPQHQRHRSSPKVRHRRHGRSSRSENHCVHCQNVCDFHRKQMQGQAASHRRDESTLKSSRLYDDASRHYLFDPTADMLYNPWLGQRFPFPEESKRSWTATAATATATAAASLKQNVTVREFSSQFLSKTVNRKFKSAKPSLLT